MPLGWYFVRPNPRPLQLVIHLVHARALKGKRHREQDCGIHGDFTASRKLDALALHINAVKINRS